MMVKERFLLHNSAFRVDKDGSGVVNVIDDDNGNNVGLYSDCLNGSNNIDSGAVMAAVGGWCCCCCWCCCCDVSVVLDIFGLVAVLLVLLADKSNSGGSVVDIVGLGGCNGTNSGVDETKNEPRTGEPMWLLLLWVKLIDCCC